MIKGKKVILRTFRENDLEEFMRKTEELEKSGEWWPGSLFSDVSWKKRYSENGFWEYLNGKMAITTLEGRLIGNINFFKGIPYTEGLEIGYRIYEPSDRGKGYMSEALSLFLGYLFSTRPVERLQICYMEGNEASRNVAEKCGFVREGTLRNAVFHRGRYRDLGISSLLRADYEKAKA